MKQFERSHHLLWMVVGGVMAWAVLAIPYLVSRGVAQQAIVFTVEFLLAAGLVGIGRQGIDVLLLRLFAVCSAVLLLDTRDLRSNCAGGWACAHEVVLVAFACGLVSLVMAIVAVPTTIAWNRGVAGLAPELPWRLVKPRKRWQVVLLATCVGLSLAGLYLFLGIPAV